MSAPVGTFCDLCVVPCVPVCVLSCSWLYLYVDTVIALGEHSKHSIVQQPRDSQYGVGVCPRVYQCVLPPPPLFPPAGSWSVTCLVTCWLLLACWLKHHSAR